LQTIAGKNRITLLCTNPRAPSLVKASPAGKLLDCFPAQIPDFPRIRMSYLTASFVQLPQESVQSSSKEVAHPPTERRGTNPATNRDQADIVALAQAGDHQAFAQLYSIHKKHVYSLCLRMVGSVAEAEDLTQEAFLQFHRKIDTFRAESALSTWLHRLTINVVLMHLRKKGLQLNSLDEMMEPDADQRPGRSFGAPDLILTGAIDRLALQRAINDLPPGYRLVFVLHDIEGFEHNEIAALLDCSIGNSKSQLHKARLKLREALGNNPRQEGHK
jgi:RNA polymerase sigma-70 factor (ECF subfamily)